jgi:hypothetical protein
MKSNANSCVIFSGGLGKDPPDQIKNWLAIEKNGMVNGKAESGKWDEVGSETIKGTIFL